MTKFLVIRIKPCPVRGPVKVVESMPLEHFEAWREMTFIRTEHPTGTVIFCEEITAAEVAEFFS